MYSKNDITHLNVMADLELRDLPKAPSWKLDLNTDKPLSLNEKILLLCSRLRSDGFSKQADGLENKFASYTIASKDSGYHTGGETGEELVERAHPEGDVTMGEASGDLADVETIVSRHKKDVAIMSKQPTGKLASYLPRIQNILMRIAQTIPDSIDLGEGISTVSPTDQRNNDTIEKYYISVINASVTLIDTIIKENMLNDFTYFDSSISESGDSADTGWLSVRTTLGHLEGAKDNLNELAKMGVSAENNQKIKANLTTVLDLIKKASKIPADRKMTYSNKARMIISKVDIALNKKYNTPSSPAPAQPALPTSERAETNKSTITPQENNISDKTISEINNNPFTKTINGYLAKLNAWDAVISVDNDENTTQAKQWIEDRQQELAEIQFKFTSQFSTNTTPEAKKEWTSAFMQLLNKSKFVQEAAEFKKVWIG